MENRRVALAVGAHPDDIEFTMAGTLLRLRERGYEIHIWNLANGSCGTQEYSYGKIVRMRTEEAQNSASLAGAIWHSPLVDDLEIYYEPQLLSQVAAGIRSIAPSVILTQPPSDYMEDHQNTCRLTVSAAFYRGMPNYATNPPVAPVNGSVALYHAMPHGLRDGFRQLKRPAQYVDVSPVMDLKKKMLGCHHSQKSWLDASQGMGSYVAEMEKMNRQVGVMSGCFEYAEGWHRHLHLGLGPADFDPLSQVLGKDCWTDPKVEAALNGTP